MIPVVNQPELTAACLAAVWKHAEGARYDVIVVDNGSRPDEIFRVGRALDPAMFLALGSNTGFGEGNNIGLEHAKGDLLFFLNNDATVSEDFLPPLLNVFADFTDAGCVSPKFLFPDGRIHEAGATVRDNGRVVQIGLGSPNDGRYNQVTPVDYCSAAAILVRRDLFEEVLGFDFRYHPAYYEDVDLCFKIRELGYKTYFCPMSVVTHQGGASRKELGHSGFNTINETNRLKFLQRWQRRLRRPSSEPPLASQEVPTRVHRKGARIFSVKAQGAIGARRVGLFTPFELMPGGGTKFLLSTLAVASRFGDVHLITENPTSQLRIAQVAAELGVEIDQVNLITLEQVDRDRPYDVFVAMDNEFMPRVGGLGRRNFFLCQFPCPVGASTIKQRRDWLDDYEAVVVYSDFVKEHFLKAHDGAGRLASRIHVIYPPVTPVDPGQAGKGKQILSVGRFFVGGHNKKHAQMIAAFKRLFDDFHLTDWELHLAGYALSGLEHRQYLLDVVAEAQGYPIFIHADPSLDELHDLYRRASVYWHAAGFEEDPVVAPEKHEPFGITTVEAMSAGCIPVVVGTAGQLEIVNNEVDGFIWRTLDELVQTTRDLMDADVKRIAELRKRARARAATFGADRFRDRIASVLDLSGAEQRQEAIGMAVEASRSDSEPNLKPASRTLPVVARRPFEKRAVLVLGMHRSGTSAVTRLLNLLGSDLPSKLMPSVPDNNALGFWESQNIAEIHDELLESAGSTWDDVAAFPRTWFDSDLAKSFQDRIVQILRADFDASRLFVIKDPRISRLLPFWRSTLNEFGAEPHFVIAVRNPLEVAASLKSREGFLPAKSLLLWLRHILEAERETRTQKRSFVCYAQLLRNWRETAAAISANLEISWPRTSHMAAVEIEMFLSESARHHSFSAEELDSRSEIVDWVKRVYAATLATDESTAPMSEVLDDVRSSLEAADQAFGPLLAEARLSLGRESERAQLADRTLTKREEELTERRNQTQRLSVDLAARDSEVQQAQEKASSSSQEIERLNHEIAVRISEMEQQARQIEELTGTLGSVNQVVADRKAEVERLSAELVSRDSEVQQSQENASSTGRELHAQRAEKGNLERQLRDQLSQSETLKQELLAQQLEADNLRQVVSEHQAKTADLEQKVFHEREVSSALKWLGQSQRYHSRRGLASRADRSGW